MIDSCGADRRSRVTERTTIQMKRYRSTRKPIFSASSVCSVSRAPSTSGSRAAEDDVRRPERDPVAVRQLLPGDAPPVQLRAVRRSEVDDEVGVSLADDLGVTARRIAVVDAEVALA